MRMVATTVLNLRHAQKLGFYSLFVYADHLSKVYKIPSVFLLNEAGLSGDPEVLKAVASHEWSALNLQPDVLWSDKDVEGQVVETLIGRLHDMNLVEESMGMLNYCDCLKVQYPSLVVLRKTKTSLIDENGIARCCGSRISQKEVHMLTTKPLYPPQYLPDLFPLWVKKDFDGIYSELAGQRLLISRVDRRRFLVATKNGNTFWLDNDIVVTLLPGVLQHFNIEIEHLVSGVSTMRQVALMMMLSAALGVQLPTQIHFLPRVSFIPGGGIETLSVAIEHFGSSRAYNALLWCATSGGKKISFDGNMFARVTGKSIEIIRDLKKYRRSLLVR